MLKGQIRPVGEYTEKELAAMYRLMSEFYDNTDESVFLRDFFDKDYCLVLYHNEAEIVGFTTQKIMSAEANGRTVHGIFSGDTIIHKDHWGDMELFKTWAGFWFDFAGKYDEFYWFLICKGIKTYRMLPVFFTEFYPNYRVRTPEYEQSIIDAYATKLYGGEYNRENGVIEYRTVKDKLKRGVADVGSREMKNKDIAFFCQANPGYIHGNDLACLAKLDRTLLNRHVAEMLFP